MTLENGINAMEQNRYADAEPIFRQLLTDGVNPEHSAQLLMLSLVLQNKINDIHQMVVEDPNCFTYQKGLSGAIMKLTMQNNPGAVQHFASQLAPNHVFLQALARLYFGFMTAASGDTDSAAPWFQDAYTQIFTAVPPLLIEDNLEQLFKAGWNMENDAYVLAQMDDADISAQKDGVLISQDILQHISTEGFVIYSSCDEESVAKFVEGEVQSLDALGKPWIFHLNIIGGTEATASKIDAMRSRLKHIILNYSIENASALHSTTYFACSRFINALTVMDIYQKNLLISDVNVTFNECLNQASAVMEGHDVGYYLSNNIMPWLRHFSTEVYVKNNPEGRKYLRALGNYCVKKLQTNRYWTLDQTAMFCIANAFDRTNQGVSFCNLLQLGANLHDVQIQMDARESSNQSRFD